MIDENSVRDRIRRIKKKYDQKDQVAEFYRRNPNFTQELERRLADFRQACRSGRGQGEWHRFCWHWAISLEWDGKLEELALYIFDSPLLVPPEGLPYGEGPLTPPERQWLPEGLGWDEEHVMLRIHPWTTKADLEKASSKITALQKSVFGFDPRLMDSGKFGRNLCWYDLRYDAERRFSFGRRELRYEQIAGLWQRYGPEKKGRLDPHSIRKAVQDLRKYIFRLTPG